jgi:hypothetical protein
MEKGGGQVVSVLAAALADMARAHAIAAVIKDAASQQGLGVHPCGPMVVSKTALKTNEFSDLNDGNLQFGCHLGAGDLDSARFSEHFHRFRRAELSDKCAGYRVSSKFGNKHAQATQTMSRLRRAPRRTPSRGLLTPSGTPSCPSLQSRALLFDGTIHREVSSRR